MKIAVSCLLLGTILSVQAKIAPVATPTTSKVLSIRGGGSHDELSPLDWRFFAAGGICAACSHGMTTPIDVVKTRMQTFPELYTQGVWQAAKDIVAKEGPGFLLAGLGPTVVGYGLEGALKFGFYEAFKIVFANLTPYVFVNFLLASVIAGAIASVVLCPMEEARIKMVGDKAWAKENVVSSIVRLVRENGLLSSFGGLNAMLSKQVPYTMGKQVSFDLIAQMLYATAAYMAVSQADAKWAISILSAFLASIVACLSSQPGDMILTATYGAHGGGHGPAPAPAAGAAAGGKAAAAASAEPTSKAFTSIVANIYRKHGLGGFYLGLSARLAHVASIITSQLVIYDLVKMALGLPVTGSH